MKIEIKTILMLVISVLIIGCVGNPSKSIGESNSKNITIQQFHDEINLLYLKCDSSLTHDNCDNFLKTKRTQFENEVQGNYLIGEGTVQDVVNGVISLLTPYPEQTVYGNNLQINIYGVQSDKLSGLKKDEKVFFRGQINLKDSGMCNTYCQIESILYVPGLSLHNGNISKTPMPTENPCLIPENPPYPNGWTKEQVKKFNERIKDQPCQKLGN